MTIVLRERQTVKREWPDAERVPALDAYWKSAIGYSWENSRATNWSLSIPGEPDVSLSIDDRTTRALRQRMSEPGFRDRAAQLHAAMLGDFRLEKILAIPAQVDTIGHIVELLRAAMHITEPLRHVGEVELELPRPADSSFTVATLHGAFANGAGTMTDYDQWVLELYAPSRVTICVERTSEPGSAPDWTIKVRHAPGTVIAPLLDAFRQHGLEVAAVVTRLAS